MSEHEHGMDVTVRMEALDGYRFRVDFPGSGAELIMDEPEPLGEEAGPNASQALSAAMGNCLSASLLFCLRRMNVEPESLEAVVETHVGRNEEGRLRVQSSDVTLRVGLDPEDRDRVGRCLDLFEDYCVVTGAVRQGIDVEVRVEDLEGNPLAVPSAVGSG